MGREGAAPRKYPCYLRLPRTSVGLLIMGIGMALAPFVRHVDEFIAAALVAGAAVLAVLSASAHAWASLLEAREKTCVDRE